MPATVSVLTNHSDDDTAEPSCQIGECGYSKARKWIACDECSHWYPCFCVGVCLKKAESLLLSALSALLTHKFVQLTLTSFSMLLLLFLIF